MSKSTKHPVLRVHYRDPDEGWEGIMVVDSLFDGVCAGGVRVSRTTDTDEVLDLARAMTRKLRALDLPLGGVKYGLRYDPNSTNKTDALTRFFQHIKPICESMAGFGPDMNTSAEGLDEVARRIGMSSRHIALANSTRNGHEGLKRYHAVLKEEIGPLTVLEARTGIGVAAATERSARVQELGNPLRVAIQGFGQVGSGTAWFLEQAGHKIVEVADVGGHYKNDDGFKIRDLVNAKRPDGTIDPEKLPKEYCAGSPPGILSTDADALVLAAHSHALSKDYVPKVRTKLIVEGGNLAVTPEAEVLLRSRGIPVVPDFLANGGAIAVVVGVIRMGWQVQSPEDLLSNLRDHIGGVVEKAARAAIQGNLSIREAALVDLD